MQRVQMMTCTEWLQACFSPHLEPAAAMAITDGLNDRLADLKVIIHFDQSQVRVVSSVLQMLKTFSSSTLSGVKVQAYLYLWFV